MGKRRDDGDAQLGPQLGNVLVAGLLADAQVRTRHHACARADGLAQEPLVVRVHLGSAARDVDRFEAAVTENGEALLERLARHLFGARGARFHMAVPACQVAFQPDVDLERVERVLGEAIFPHALPEGWKGGERLVHLFDVSHDPPLVFLAKRGPGALRDQALEGYAMGLHLEVLYDFLHLHAMGERRAAADRIDHVEGLGHLLFGDALLQAGVRVGVDAVRALHGGCHGERDDGLLAGGQRALLEHLAVVRHEEVPQLRGAFANAVGGELCEICRVVIRFHGELLSLGLPAARCAIWRIETCN